MDPKPLAQEHHDAADIAHRAGQLLMALRSHFPTPENLKEEGDRLSHEFIAAELHHRYPADGVLSEEGSDSPERSGLPRVWIVDPLDGTREFGEPPRIDWAVHVALVVDGQLEVGAVALPGRDLTLSTDAPPTRTVRPTSDRLRMVVSRSRASTEVQELAGALDADVIPMGSAGAKAMAVVLGEADVYAHSGGQYEWDSAAPVAVALAAGLHTSRMDGSPMVYNEPDPWLPDLLICRPELAQRVISTYR